MSDATNPEYWQDDLNDEDFELAILQNNAEGDAQLLIEDLDELSRRLGPEA